MRVKIFPRLDSVPFKVFSFQIADSQIRGCRRSMTTSDTNDLHLVPLGAGDLIDRAVRLYRRHLLTLMRIAAPPVMVSAIGWVMWTVGVREVGNSGSTAEFAFYVLLILGALIVIVSGHIFSVIVMGGASRNLVMHLLWNEPVLARTTYAAVKSRFWSLLGAALLVMGWVIISSMLGSFGAYLIIILLGVVVVLFGSVAPLWFTVLVGFAGGAVVAGVFLWLFFFLLGKVAYVPQVLLVEGKGVFESLSRSFSLARGNVRRLMAMTFFITFATYSALMILVIPLGWYGYLNGIDPSPWNASQWPFWYAIGYGIMEPLSSILLAPVWMLGMSLLYVDERVRHEGYDIELMASQKLIPMPDINVTSPFAPAISVAPRLPLQRPATGSMQGSILGLR